MKKQIKITVFAAAMFMAVISTFTAHAQLSVGVRAGANFATEPVPNFYHVFLARPYVGLVAQYNLDSPLGIQTGLNYSGEGANYKDLSSGDVYHVRHSFLTIPVLLNYKFGFGGYIEAGPQFGFLLSAKEQENGGSTIDTKQYYKGTDVSAGLGFGYDLKGGLGINIRYMRGLTALNKTSVAGEDDIKSRVLSLGLTYKISGYGKK